MRPDKVTVDGRARKTSLAPSPETPLPVRAVIYSRVSSLAQRDQQTIASQLEALPRFVTLRGWDLVKSADTYVDDGRTAKAGYLSERLGFTRLLQDAGLGQFDVVVVVDLDRLTRSEDLRERGEVLGAFQKAGVQIAVSSSGQVLDLRSSMGDLMSSLGAFFAAEENRKRRDRICRGKAEAIRKGRKPAGPTPFGYLYDRKTGAWSVDPELGPIVVEIFTRVSRGETCESIARDLQARGVPRARPSIAGNRRPGVWCLERVHQVVRARTYLGTWVADRARGLSVTVPRIVSEALCHQADVALRRAGRRGRLRNPHMYLLQGMATCGLCGASIGCASTGNWSTAQGNRRHFYYVCSRRRRGIRGADKTCTLPMVRSDRLDARFWEAIVEGVIREDHLEKALRERASESLSEPDRAADVLRHEAELKRLVRAEEILLERFRRGVVTEAALDRELLVLTKDRASATEAIASVREGMRTKADLGRELVSLREAAAGLRERLRIATPQDRRDIVQAIVTKGESGVILGPERIEARVLLAPRDDVAFAQVYTAG
jgi:site-specific DNA recombinase